MPEGGLNWMPKEQLLSYEEIGRLAGIFSAMGITKVRITGGEPTIRSDIGVLIKSIASVPGITDLAMTTNGHTLAKLAPMLADSGLSRVNVSLDSIRPETFQMLTRGGQLDRVLHGLDAARAAGLTPIKINAVVVGGLNDDQILELVQFFEPQADNTELRFIEYMPFEDRRYTTVPSFRIRQIIEEKYSTEPITTGPTNGPARMWKIQSSGLRVGFISPLSNCFCETCNRLRLMADGHLRTCLAYEDTPSLLNLLRGGASDSQIAQAIRSMVLGKPEGHQCDVDGGEAFQGVMTGIGG